MPTRKTRKISKDRWKIPPSVVLACISKNYDFLPTVPNYGGYSIEEDVYRVRIYLWHDAKRYKPYVDLAKKNNIPTISESVLIDILDDSRQKKYRERKSPPFPANKLCGSILQGNDGEMYISEKNKASCSWKLVKN